MKSCLTCKHAGKWEKTPTGRIRKNSVGRCLAPVEISNQPVAVVVQVSRRAVWRNDGADCPAYEVVK